MEDTEIISLLWERQESGLDEILRRYGRMLKQFAGRILPTAQDAEECVNDALLDMWNTITPKRPVSIVSYAAMLTRRRAVDRVRRLTAKKRGGGVYLVALDELGDCIPGDSAPAEDTDALREAIDIFLESLGGRELVGKELTVRLLYAQDGDGFTSIFTPDSCFTDKSWDIGRTYEFGGHRISLDRAEESALYVTLFIDCATIGHSGDDYAFVLSDELGNDYSAYPNEDSDSYGYWFTKPETLGTQLILKVIRSGQEPGLYGEVSDGSYEVLYEIPVELPPGTPMHES